MNFDWQTEFFRCVRNYHADFERDTTPEKYNFGKDMQFFEVLKGIKMFGNHYRPENLNTWHVAIWNIHSTIIEDENYISASQN